MAVNPLSVLHNAVFLAVVFGVYGWLVGVVSAPVLAAGRVRRLLDALPPADWRVNYALWVPLPAALWGFLCGATLSVSLAYHPPGPASPLYVSGVDGILVATAVSVALWPALLLYVLPARGVDWYADESAATTALLVVGATVWYLAWLAVPAYAITIMAGFGDALSRG